MSKPIARYSVSFGLEGCYLPDSHGGVYECHTRKELADIIRGEMQTYDLPKSLFAGVKIRRLWSFIKQHGSSSAHFSIYHKGYSLAFHGLTEEEFNQQNEEI